MSIVCLGLISFGLWFISMIVIMVFLELQRVLTGTRAYTNEWLVLLSFVAPVVKIHNFITARKREANDNEKLIEQYQLQLSKYQEKIKENFRSRQLDEDNRNAKTIFLQVQQKEAEKELTESKTCLQKIYATNIIFPKCRNLVMVCSLYEYISQITGSIRDMSASLDGIYSSAFQQNENTTQLNAHIAELQKSSALTAYHAERAQKELAYINRMDYFAGRNDDVFWNHPPV